MMKYNSQLALLLLVVALTLGAACAALHPVLQERS